MQYAHRAKATITGEFGKYSPACLHADNMLDADSSVGLTSGYGGDTYDAVWVQDPDVGVVIECNKVCLLLRHSTGCEVLGQHCVTHSCCHLQLTANQRMSGLCLMHLYLCNCSLSKTVCSALRQLKRQTVQI